MSQDYFRVILSGSIRVAVPLRDVETVCKINPRQVCQIPGVVHSLLGVYNRQGTLTWVWNLSEFLELDLRGYNPGKDWTAVVITRETKGTREKQGDKRSVACVVAGLEGVFEYDAPRAFGKPLKKKLQPLFTGVAYHEKLHIAVLNTSGLLEALDTEGRRNETAAFELNEPAQRKG